MVPLCHFFNYNTLFNRRLKKNFKVKVFSFKLHVFLLSSYRNIKRKEALKYFKLYFSTFEKKINTERISTLSLI